MEKICKNCVHGHKFNFTVEPPKDQKLFGLISLGPHWSDEWQYDYKTNMNKNYVMCKRYPKSVDKRNTDYCAEFKESA